MAGERWVPTQYKQAETVDLREAKLGPKGFKERNKRKLEELEEQAAQEEDVAAAMEEDAPMEDQHPSSKRQKATGGKAIPVSGRIWKAPAERAGKVMKAAVGVSWEKKMALKAARQQFLEHKKAAVGASKEKRKMAAGQRKAARALKEANRKKSEVVTKVSTATVKKMMKSKKQKKMLRTADTN